MDSVSSQLKVVIEKKDKSFLWTKSEEMMLVGLIWTKAYGIKQIKLRNFN